MHIQIALGLVFLKHTLIRTLPCQCLRKFDIQKKSKYFFFLGGGEFSGNSLLLGTKVLVGSFRVCFGKKKTKGYSNMHCQ